MTGETFPGGGYVTTTPSGVPSQTFGSVNSVMPSTPPPSPATGLPAVVQPDPYYTVALQCACTLFRREGGVALSEDDDQRLWVDVMRYADAMAELLKDRSVRAATQPAG